MATSYYNELIKIFDQRQTESARAHRQLVEEIYDKVPRLKVIAELIAEKSAQVAIASLRKDVDISSYKEEIGALTKERSELLSAYGYSPSALTMKYRCSECSDTGFVDNKPCKCFMDELLTKLYDQSNLKNVLRAENFSAFTYDYYDNTRIDPATGLTSLQNMQKVVKICVEFIKEFDRSFTNLVFYGDTGTGKTFLSNCIAGELLSSYHNVLYLSAHKLFEALSYSGNAQSAEEKEAVKAGIYNSDLLIIDDLGTEHTNSYIQSLLFNCINERLLNKKPVIISTNLSLKGLQDTYSDRIFSRIASNYKMLKFYGEDIRMCKKTED